MLFNAAVSRYGATLTAYLCDSHSALEPLLWALESPTVVPTDAQIKRIKCANYIYNILSEHCEDNEHIIHILTCKTNEESPAYYIRNNKCILAARFIEDYVMATAA